MKFIRLHHVYAYLLLLIAMGMAVHTPFTVWMSVQYPLFAEVTKAWKEILMFCAAVLLCVEVTKANRWRFLLDDLLIRLMVIYIGLHLLAAAVAPLALSQEVAGLMIDLRFIAYFLLVYTLVTLHPIYRVSMLLVMGVGAVIVLGFAVMQLMLPADILKYLGYGPETIMPYLTIDRNEDFIRINSTLRGPNPLGVYAATALLLAGSYVIKNVKSRKHSIIAAVTIISTLIALWYSYSRSAWLAAGVGVLLLVVHYRQQIPQKVLTFVGGWGLLVGVVFMIFGGSLVSHLVLHEDPMEGNDINSNHGHIESLATGMARMVNQPFGAGVGSTGSASLLGDAPFIIENYYLFVAHEVGWAGLVLFIVIYSLVLWRLWKRRSAWLAFGLWASGCGVAFAALFLPVWADDTVSILWWGLAATVLAKGEGDGKTAK